MTISTTPEFWAIDGETLQTYAFNIESWGGERQTPPPLRGEDVVIPHAPGRKWYPKVPDARVITLGMWVIGINEDGSFPDNNREQFDENWRKLRGLLFHPYRQFSLTKRIVHPISGMYVEVEALGQYAGGMTPSMLGRNGARFTVDIMLNDPYFYSTTLETIEFTTAEETQEFVVIGDDRSYETTVTFYGPLTDPQIVNQTDDEEIMIKYVGTIASGDKVIVNVKDFSAVYDPASGANYKVTGNVQNTGDYYWMRIDPGQCKLVFSRTSGAGTADLTYRPGWI